MKRRITLILAALVTSMACAGTALAQAWPNKPVKIIVPFPAGGATDAPARMLAEKLGGMWGQSVIVENRAGAGGTVGAVEAARAAPDGYTLFFPSGAVMTANQHIYSNPRYNPERDFVPIATVASGPMVIVVPANSPYKSLKDLLDAARAKPKSLSFGHAGVGSQSHLASEGFLKAANIQATAIAYKGDPPALVDLAGGTVDFCVANITAALTLVKGGKLRALGVAAPAPIAQLPNVPLVSATVPGYEARGWFGIVAPAGTPKDIVQKISQDVRIASADPSMKERVAAMGMDMVGDTPEDMKRTMERESARIAALVKERQIRID
ncbi:tripartite tricarboxylate transporter substrate binding protein [Imbroritus primus]|uniref:Tripartite tricarboxylate transporter substrate binding protein n=1 Tax=Imbroritus primus TaxID=3058603 RepID=A0ACD3SRN5_9BURK|nr:tripartite tricarboxylate transporter substrate binding protein [Burkholderiaceae bacterium PBA]